MDLDEDAQQPPPPPKAIAIVHVSTSSIRVAKILASDILKRDLAIGVSVLPTHTTMYKWKGEVVNETESLMIVKTRTTIVEELLNYINSTTAVPDMEDCEIIAMKVENEYNPYLNWLADRIPENCEDLSINSTK